MKPNTETHDERSDVTDESAIVDLIDRMEALGSELADARAELERLRRDRREMQDELSTARGWVRVLATEVEELNRRLAGR